MRWSPKVGHIGVVVVALVVSGCAGDGGEGGSGPLADLPPTLGSAVRIVADGRGADHRRLDGGGTGELPGDSTPPVTHLGESMEFLGYTDFRDQQGGYYHDAAGPAGPRYVVAITAERGKTSPAAWVSRILEKKRSRDEDRVEPGDARLAQAADGGRILCNSSPVRPPREPGLAPQRAHASCWWADDHHLVNVDAEDADIPTVRAMVDTIRRGTPARP
ncbi:hypothetical protein [Embleya sp. NPDC050493]|uniref:hypothetical protein n=1 Tax=Embleya sp. NPDC050493 TaxID=3363989 RepID=UPI0037A8DD27